MRIAKVIKPGEAGAKKLQKEFGDRLICVRYRYDPEKGVRLKTVELIVDEKFWNPPVSEKNPDRICRIKIHYWEKKQQAKVKSVGGRWLPEKKVWELPYYLVIQLDLKDRIVS